MYEGVVRVKSWDEFKRLVDEQKPNSVVYVIEQSGPPTRQPTTLRLMFPSPRAYYVFLDFPKGEILRETHIPLSKDKYGGFFIEENDVKDFLRKQLGKDLTICAYWTI